MTVLSQPFASVFKPGTFGIVLRVVSERTAAKVTGVSIVRRCLCSTGTGQASVAIECEKRFCVHRHIPQPPDDTQAATVPVRAACSGVNGGSVKIWTGVWVKQAGCFYSTVVVTQWPTDVKNSQQAEMDIGGGAVSVAGRNGKECAMVKSPYGSYGIAMS